MKTKTKIRKNFFVTILMFFFFSNYVNAQLYVAIKPVIYDSSATSGYYFFTPKVSNLVWHPPGGIKLSQMILDRFGEVIYFKNWTDDGSNDFKIQPNGLMTYSHAGDHFIMDSTFSIIDSVHTKLNFNYDQHDIQILPNGHYLFLGGEKVQMDLSSYHLFNKNNSPGSTNASVRCGIIQEQDENQNVVFNWRAKNYYDFEDTDPNYLLDTSNVDWNHCNAVELDNDGNILLSVRRFNEITKINRTDSTIMWRLGGPKNQFTFLNDSIQFRTQHDIRRISNGNITLFDNGDSNLTPRHPCIAKEYKLNETLKTAELVWSYTYDSTKVSTWLGNVQRLQNGNTMIGYGNLYGSDIIFSCVDSIGNKIFEVKSPDSTVNTYRAFNYPTLPWNLNRPKIRCEEINGQLYLNVDTGLAGYKWNTGDSTYKIAATNLDTFYVYVSRGTGGFIRSENFIVSAQGNPCIPCPVTATPGLIAGNTAPCQGSIITYSVSLDASASSYTWTLPPGWSGHSNTNSISATVGAVSGTISVRADNLCGGSAPRNLAVVVNPLPSQTNNITGSSSVCPNSSYNYSVAAVPGAISYSWILPAGWSGASSVNMITVLTNGNGGTLSVRAINGCGSGPVRNKTLTMNSVPASPGMITSSSGTKVCMGDIRNYSITPVTNALSYTWLAPNGASISGGQGTTNVSVTYGAGFTISDSLRVMAVNVCGNSDPHAKLIKYLGPAQPGGITGSHYSVCGSLGVPYSVSLVSGLTYNWSFSNTNATIATGQGSNAITANFGSSYSTGNLTVVAANSCGFSPARNTNINAFLKAPGTLTGTSTVCQNQQAVPYSVTPVTGATSYTWSGPAGSRFSDGIATSTTSTFTTTSTSVTVNFKTTAGYIKVKANNPCGSSLSKSMWVTFNCRNNQLHNRDLNSLVVFPNPSTHLINASIYMDKDELYDLTLSDLTGRLLYVNHGNGLAGRNEVQIDIPNLSKGVYIIQLNSETITCTLRHIVN